MRRIALFLLGLTFLTVGCAYEGTIVRKDWRPLPFSYSLALDAIYHFDLRGSDGKVHRQMVTAAAFASYKVGDYFSDLRPLPLTSRARFTPDFGPLPGPLEDLGTPYRMGAPPAPVPSPAPR